MVLIKILGMARERGKGLLCSFAAGAGSVACRKAVKELIDHRRPQCTCIKFFWTRRRQAGERVAVLLLGPKSVPLTGGTTSWPVVFVSAGLGWVFLSPSVEWGGWWQGIDVPAAQIVRLGIGLGLEHAAGLSNLLDYRAVGT